MPVLNPDTSQAQDFTTPIEPGTYHAKIVACAAQNSKKGNPMIVPKFEITMPDGKTRTRQAYLVITGEGAMGFDQILRACHMTDLADQLRDPSVSPKPSFDTDTLVGQELQVIIEPNLYEGQKRDQIAGYLRN